MGSCKIGHGPRNKYFPVFQQAVGAANGIDCHEAHIPGARSIEHLGGCLGRGGKARRAKGPLPAHHRGQALGVVGECHREWRTALLRHRHKAHLGFIYFYQLGDHCVVGTANRIRHKQTHIINSGVRIRMRWLRLVAHTAIAKLPEPGDWLVRQIVEGNQQRLTTKGGVNGKRCFHQFDPHNASQCVSTACCEVLYNQFRQKIPFLGVNVGGILNTGQGRAVSKVPAPRLCPNGEVGEIDSKRQFATKGIQRLKPRNGRIYVDQGINKHGVRATPVKGNQHHRHESGIDKLVGRLKCTDAATIAKNPAGAVCIEREVGKFNCLRSTGISSVGNEIGHRGVACCHIVWQEQRIPAAVQGLDDEGDVVKAGILISKTGVLRSGGTTRHAKIPLPRHHRGVGCGNVSKHHVSRGAAQSAVDEQVGPGLAGVHIVVFRQGGCASEGVCHGEGNIPEIWLPGAGIDRQGWISVGDGGPAPGGAIAKIPGIGSPGTARGGEGYHVRCLTQQGVAHCEIDRWQRMNDDGLARSVGTAAGVGDGDGDVVGAGCGIIADHSTLVGGPVAEVPVYRRAGRGPAGKGYRLTYTGRGFAHLKGDVGSTHLDIIDLRHGIGAATHRVANDVGHSVTPRCIVGRAGVGGNGCAAVAKTPEVGGSGDRRQGHKIHVERRGAAQGVVGGKISQWRRVYQHIGRLLKQVRTAVDIGYNEGHGKISRLAVAVLGSLGGIRSAIAKVPLPAGDGPGTLG